MKQRWWPLVGVVLAVLGSGGGASADALPPPPACPPGARGATSHAGLRCVPAPCDDDADCKELGAACRRWRVCTRSTEVPPHRRMPDAPPRTEQVVVGTCSPAERCTGTEQPPPPLIGDVADGPPSCAEGRYCVPAALPPLPTQTSGAPRAPGGPGRPAAPGQATPPGKGAGCGACSCRLGAGGGAHPAGWLGLLLLGGALLRRRR